MNVNEKYCDRLESVDEKGGGRGGPEGKGEGGEGEDDEGEGAGVRVGGGDRDAGAPRSTSIGNCLQWRVQRMHESRWSTYMIRCCKLSRYGMRKMPCGRNRCTKMLH